MRRLQILVLTFLAALPAGSVSFAQRDGAQRDPARLQEMRERWSQKSEAEREVLRRRYEELRRLPDEDRAKLQDRLRRFEAHEAEARRSMSAEDRRRLEQLPREERERMWRDRAFERSRERGRSLREGLPYAVRERLESASPGERRRMIDEWKRRDRDRWSREGLRTLGRGLELAPEEVRRLEELPLEERIERMRGLKRRQLERRVRAEGLPEGLTRERWEQLQQLPDERFLEAVRPHLRDRHRRGDLQRRRGPRTPESREPRRPEEGRGAELEERGQRERPDHRSRRAPRRDT